MLSIYLVNIKTKKKIFLSILFWATCTVSTYQHQLRLCLYVKTMHREIGLSGPFSHHVAFGESVTCVWRAYHFHLYIEACILVYIYIYIYMYKYIAPISNFNFHAPFSRLAVRCKEKPWRVHCPKANSATGAGLAGLYWTPNLNAIVESC